MAAKPDKQKVYRELVEKQLPNFRFVEPMTPDSPASRAVADSVTPDLATLRRKFLGQDAANRTRGQLDAATTENVQPENSDAEIVRVEPKNASSWGRGAGAKAVVISKGKIIGMQG
jgi:hypothetical protein